MLEDEVRRLQAQLQKGYDGYNALKESKGEEIRQLGERVEQLEARVRRSLGQYFLLVHKITSPSLSLSPLQLRTCSAAEAELSKCRSELASTNGALETLGRERDGLAAEAGEAKQRATAIEQELEEALKV